MKALHFITQEEAPTCKSIDSETVGWNPVMNTLIKNGEDSITIGRCPTAGLAHNSAQTCRGRRCSPSQ